MGKLLKCGKRRVAEGAADAHGLSRGCEASVRGQEPVAEPQRGQGEHPRDWGN